jgi:divalent metal cation (Fe/Co/Zn/Cd) transporter
MLVSVSVIKIWLFAVCYRWRHVSGSIRALAFDHIADAVSNCVALLAAVMAGSQRSRNMFGPDVWMADPVGGGGTASKLRIIRSHRLQRPNRLVCCDSPQPASLL